MFNASSDDFSASWRNVSKKLPNLKDKCSMQVLLVQSNNYLQFFEFWIEEENKVSVLFYNQDNTCLILTGVNWDESGPFYNYS